MTLRTAFIIRNGRFPLSMEEIIAAELLGQTDKSLPERPYPVAVIDPEMVCARCNHRLEVKEERA